MSARPEPRRRGRGIGQWASYIWTLLLLGFFSLLFILKGFWVGLVFTFGGLMLVTLLFILDWPRESWRTVTRLGPVTLTTPVPPVVLVWFIVCFVILVRLIGFLAPRLR